MKTLKKTLAVILALAMVLGMTVSASAAYSDEAKITDKEAVEVMSAVGVFIGSNGAFDPQGNLTREQAAKLIAYLMLGEEVAEALPAVKVFDDVDATRWSSKYIAYCASEEIIAGVGNNKFAPTEPLTGYQFGKMLLCCLGFDAEIEGYVGSNWQINVAKEMSAQKIAAVAKNEAGNLNREQGARYCLNALKAKTVDYEEEGTTIKAGDVVITTGASKAKVELGKGFGKGTGLLKDTLAAFLYGTDLKLTETTNDLGEVANKWTYAKLTGTDKVVGTYAKEATQSLVVASGDGTVAVADLLKDDDYFGYDASDITSAVYTLNGADATATDLVAAGDTVEVFEKDDVVTNVAIVRYEVAKITKISTKVSKADADDDVTCYVTLDTADNAAALPTIPVLKDTKFAGFNYAEKDVVLVAVNAARTEVLASKLAAVVEGEVTAVKSGKITVDGAAYKVVDDTTAKPQLEEEGKFYLNDANEIVAFKITEAKSSDYAYAYSVKVAQDTNEYGIADSYTVTVYMALADGTLKSYVLDADEYTEVGTPATDINITDVDIDFPVDATTTTAFAFAYEINKDGELEIVKASDEIDVASAINVDKNAAVIGSAFADAETVFVFAYKDGSKVKTQVVTGYKNVDVNSEDVYYVYDKTDKNVLYAFVGAKNGVASSDTLYAVALDSAATVTKNDSNYLWTYSVAGETNTIVVKDSSKTAATLEKGYVYEYVLDGDYAIKSSIIPVATATDLVEFASDDYAVVGGTQIAFAADAEFYTVTIDYAKDGKFTVTVTEAADLAAEDEVIYVLNTDGKIMKAWVYEVVGYIPVV